MDGLARLEAIEQIKQLKGRYFAHMDLRSWDEWRDVFADDAVMDVSGQYPDAPDPSVYVMRGADAIVAMVTRALVGIVTAHHGHTPLISIESDDTAKAIWAMEDNLFLPDGSRMLGYGHYHEQYRRIGAAWKIAHTRLTRLKVVHVPPVAAA